MNTLLDNVFDPQSNLFNDFLDFLKRIDLPSRRFIVLKSHGWKKNAVCKAKRFGVKCFNVYLQFSSVVIPLYQPVTPAECHIVKKFISWFSFQNKTSTCSFFNLLIIAWAS